MTIFAITAGSSLVALILGLILGRAAGYQEGLQDGWQAAIYKMADAMLAAQSKP